MPASLRHSKKGVSTIVAEVFMLLIVIIMSSIIFVWVVPVFQSNQVRDSTARYDEKFSTLWGSFATFAPSTPEPLIDFSWDPWSQDYVCTGSITTPFTGNVYVPANGKCVITATVGNVYVASGANLTVVGTTINGGLLGWYAASITLKNVNVVGWTGISNAQVVSITGSSLNTSGNTGVCTDACDSAMYEGGRGTFTFVNNYVNGQIESEVSHQAFITGNTVTGRLEVESADFGQITNNKAGMMDFDQNGIVVVAGNTVYGNDPYFPGVGILWGNPPNYNQWCAQGNNVISGANDITRCIGNIEIDITNTGSIPVNLVQAYMSNVPLSGPISWKLTSGGGAYNSLPVTIPVGQSANVTMQWTPPVGIGTLPWMGIYFVFVSSHNNFVDGWIYFGYNPALTLTGQSRPLNQVCPPCH